MLGRIDIHHYFTCLFAFHAVINSTLLAYWSSRVSSSCTPCPIRDLETSSHDTDHMKKATHPEKLDYEKFVIYSQLSHQLIFALWFKLKGLAIAQNVLRETEEQDLVSRRQELCIACASMYVCLLEFVLRIYKVDLDSDAISEHLLFKIY